MIKVLKHKLILLFDNIVGDDYIEWVYKCNLCEFMFVRYFNERHEHMMSHGLSQYYKVHKIVKRTDGSDSYAVYRYIVPLELTCEEEQVKRLLE